MPSDAAKRKACELANAHCIPTRHRSDDVHVGYSSLYALALRLDFEDLLARRVDGFLKLRGDTPTSHARDALRSLMLPDPPDPDEELAREVVECIRESSLSDADRGDADRFRAALEKRGLKIVKDDCHED